NYEYISQLGGPDFITRIKMQGKVENFETYEKALIEQHKSRYSKELARNYSENGNDIKELMQELEELDELGIKEEVDVTSLLDGMYDLPCNEPQEVETNSVPIDLECILGGFKNQNSYIVDARPSIVKSASML